MHQTDSLNLLIGIAINIPILYFLLHNWEKRKCNGIYRIARVTISWWIVALFIRHNFTLYMRYRTSIGVPVDTEITSALSLLTNIVVLLMTCYAAFTFMRIVREKETH